MANLRAARTEDHAVLRQIDRETWSSRVSPAPAPAADTPFFGRADPAEVLVAEVEGRVVGYVTVQQALPIPSHEHVLEIGGLAVSQAHQGQGVARALIEEAKVQARRRGAHKLTLRVLGPNAPARRLYASCGFRVEGTLTAEFLLDGTYVDDVLMACPLT